MRRLLGCSIVSTISVLGAVGDAAAVEPTGTERAHAFYDDGVKAHQQGDYARAAHEFARADLLVPNDAVLKDALGEAVRSEDAAFGLMLVARAARSPKNAELQEAVAKAKEKFRGGAGRIDIECPGRCVVEIDGRAPDADAEYWLPVGPHVVVMTSDAHPGHRDEHRVEVLALETSPIRFVPPPRGPVVATAPRPVAPPRPAPRGGLSPVWFYAGAGATLVLAGATAISGFDVNRRRTEFEDGNCPAVGNDVCNQSASDGRAAVTRTNILLGATAVVGGVTAATLFFVRWRSGVTTSVGAAQGGPRMTLTGHF